MPLVRMKGFRDGGESDWMYGQTSPSQAVDEEFTLDTQVVARRASLYRQGDAAQRVLLSLRHSRLVRTRPFPEADSCPARECGRCRRRIGLQT